jgi:hypothetical protein
MNSSVPNLRPGLRNSGRFDSNIARPSHGIRTVAAEAWEARMQGADTLQAFMRDRYGEPDADDIGAIRNLEHAVAPLRPSRA